MNNYAQQLQTAPSKEVEKQIWCNQLESNHYNVMNMKHCFDQLGFSLNLLGQFG
jgi:hypothetical protein